MRKIEYLLTKEEIDKSIQAAQKKIHKNMPTIYTWIISFVLIFFAVLSGNYIVIKEYQFMYLFFEAILLICFAIALFLPALIYNSRLKKKSLQMLAVDKTNFYYNADKIIFECIFDKKEYLKIIDLLFLDDLIIVFDSFQTIQMLPTRVFESEEQINEVKSICENLHQKYLDHMKKNSDNKN